MTRKSRPSQRPGAGRQNVNATVAPGACASDPGVSATQTPEPRVARVDIQPRSSAVERAADRGGRHDLEAQDRAGRHGGHGAVNRHVVRAGTGGLPAGVPLLPRMPRPTVSQTRLA